LIENDRPPMVILVLRPPPGFAATA